MEYIVAAVILAGIGYVIYKVYKKNKAKVKDLLDDDEGE